MAAIGEEPIAARVRRLLEPVLERDGFELVEVEWLRVGGRWTLRVFVDRQGGVGIDECQEVSRTVEPILDVEDLIEPAYDLEVSSPGVERPLRKASDFDRFAGQDVQMTLNAPLDGAKRVKAKLKGTDGDAVRIETPAGDRLVAYATIERARLVPKIDWRKGS